MMHRSRLAIAVGTLATIAATGPGAAVAEAASPAELAAIRVEIDGLRAAQAARITEMQQVESRLSALAAIVMRLEGATAAPAPDTATDAPAAVASPSPAQAAKPRLQLSGDFRVRYEDNTPTDGVARRDRGVVRARLRADYALSDQLYLGGMLSTGDPANPRTGDVTLSGFGGDLPIKLAQAYVRGEIGPLQLTAGKMPQPFQRTELVWDGDFNPQGVAAAYGLPFGAGGSLKLTGLYFMVDESAAGPDSDMFGSQLFVGHSLAADLKLELSAAYYDYTLRGVPGTSPAAFRGNLVGPDGRYLSDFELFDGMVAVRYDGLGPRWPVRLIGDYVKNLGAAVDDDTGFELDLLVGRASQPRDWRIMYGYSEAGVDAVLGAFSTDNTDISTNYLQHALAIDYVLSSHVMLNATAYHYRPKNAAFAGSRDPDEWLNRMRLNLQVSF